MDQSGRSIKWRFLKVEPMTPFLLIWLIIWSQLDIKAKSIDFNLGFPLKYQHLDQIRISDQWSIRDYVPPKWISDTDKTDRQYISVITVRETLFLKYQKQTVARFSWHWVDIDQIESNKLHSIKSIEGVQCPTVLNPDHPYFKDYKTSRQILISFLPSGKRIET